MFRKPLISIIIPVYNRADLLSITLDSIISQTFSEWECILVDDHSTDQSYKVMAIYEKKDTRFKIFKRPSTLNKGANSCRNFGFEKSSGSTIKWFDSDDIMLQNHLEVAYEAMVKNNLDFVVTDTMNFNDKTNEFLGKPYDFDRKNESITSENFAHIRIGWITDDFLGKRNIVQLIKFNENITDGDEYNFFIRMLQNPLKGEFLNEIVTHRRIHSGTISTLNRADKINYMLILANLKYQTALDLVFYDNKELIKWFLSGYMRILFDLALLGKGVPSSKEASCLIRKYFSCDKLVAFLAASYLGFYFKKGYNIMKYART
jgi:glycosyltransferase involved in cell wall biosynthesis